MKTEYIVKAFEQELGTELYKVTVPKGTSEKEAMKAFENATKYVDYSGDFTDGFNIPYEEIEEIYELRETDLPKFIEIGKKNYDEHFEKMLELEEEHRLEIFEYYITDCMGWKIEFITYDFEFEW